MGIDWLAAVHVPDTRQAIPTLIARYYSLLEWPLLGGDADRFNPFWTLETAYNVGVFYRVRGGHVWVGDGSHERSLWSQRFRLRRPPDEKGTISAFHTGVRI